MRRIVIFGSKRRRFTDCHRDNHFHVNIFLRTRCSKHLQATRLLVTTPSRFCTHQLCNDPKLSRPQSTLPIATAEALQLQHPTYRQQRSSAHEPVLAAAGATPPTTQGASGPPPDAPHPHPTQQSTSQPARTARTAVAAMQADSATRVVTPSARRQHSGMLLPASSFPPSSLSSPFGRGFGCDACPFFSEWALAVRKRGKCSSRAVQALGIKEQNVFRSAVRPQNRQVHEPQN